jgi:hypothetical protein
LQNGNVIIAQNIRLIDYDGIYVPGLPRGQGAELGHKHFQHPSRSAADFGPDMDRFSFIVIELSLRALSRAPSLFSKYSNGENIIFTASDFANPGHSSLFQELSCISELRRDVLHFARVCAASVKEVPQLTDFIDGNNIPDQRIIISQKTTSSSDRVHPTYVGAYDVIDAFDFDLASRRIGDRVELVGVIVDVKVGSTKYGKPYVFLNFGNWRSSTTKVNLWSEGLARLSIIPDRSWKGKWISVTGLVDAPYTNKRFGYTHISITVTEPNQLRVIDEAEARRRIASGKSSSGRVAQADDTPKRSNATILEHITGNAALARPIPGSVSVRTRNQQILSSTKTGPPSTFGSAAAKGGLPPIGGRVQRGNLSWLGQALMKVINRWL